MQVHGRSTQARQVTLRLVDRLLRCYDIGCKTCTMYYCVCYLFRRYFVLGRASSLKAAQHQQNSQLAQSKLLSYYRIKFWKELAVSGCPITVHRRLSVTSVVAST